MDLIKPTVGKDYIPSMPSLTSRTAIFSKFLRDRLSELKMEPRYFGRGVGLRDWRRALGWINGLALPPYSRIPAIAYMLDADALDVFTLWLGFPSLVPS